MSLPDQAHDGAMAKQIIDNPAFDKGVQALETALIDAWKSCDNAEGREDAWRLINLLPRFKHVLQIAINDGEIAQHDLKVLNGDAQNVSFE